MFGVGSMIYSGIEIGMFFEMRLDDHVPCRNYFSLVRPILQMVYVFVQMYFVFLNQKVGYLMYAVHINEKVILGIVLEQKKLF